MSAKYQAVWRWRSFLWPFYVCDCEQHDGDTHVVFDGWTPFALWRYVPERAIFTIYRWILRVGPLEIRRWVDDDERHARIAAHNEANRT